MRLLQWKTVAKVMLNATRVIEIAIEMGNVLGESCAIFLSKCCTMLLLVSLHFAPRIEKMSKKRILFLCTHNAARSQMAEGFVNARYGDRYEAYSAGSEPTEVHPCAVAVMAEAGIDISGHRAKSLDVFDDASFDYVVTMCVDAQENCPIFPGRTAYLHHAFADPFLPTVADSDSCASFRHVRLRIGKWIELTFGDQETEKRDS
jgi:arsenate reductase